MMIALALASTAVQDSDVQRQVEEWVTQLEAEDPATREEAEEAIRQLGAAAIPHLERIQQFPGPEARARVQDLLRELRQGPTSSYYGPVVYVTLDESAGPASALASRLSQLTPWKVDVMGSWQRQFPAVCCAELPFLAAIDAISAQTEMRYRLALNSTSLDLISPLAESDVVLYPSGAHHGPAVYPGPIRIGVETITRKRTFQFDEDEDTIEVDLMVLWQPNVLPARIEHELQEAVSSAGEVLAEPAREMVGWKADRAGYRTGQGPMATVVLRPPLGAASLAVRGRFFVSVPDEAAVLRAPLTLPAEFERGGRTLRLEPPPEDAGEGAILTLRVHGDGQLDEDPFVRFLDEAGDVVRAVNASWVSQIASPEEWRATLVAGRWDDRPLEIGQVEVLFPDRTRTYEVPYRFDDLSVPEYWE